MFASPIKAGIPSVALPVLLSFRAASVEIVKIGDKHSSANAREAAETKRQKCNPAKRIWMGGRVV